MKITPAFFDGIRELIAGARTTVARGVDLVQVHTNFEIGRRIVKEELRGKDRAAYGKEVVKELADRLTGEFGKGFSLSNLKSMRQFYLQEQGRIGQTVSGQFDTPSISQSMTGQFNAPSIGQTVSDQMGNSSDSVWKIRFLLNSPVNDWRIWRFCAPSLHPELDPLRLPPPREGPERA